MSRKGWASRRAYWAAQEQLRITVPVDTHAPIMVINRRGCTEPLTPETIEALKQLGEKAYDLCSAILPKTPDTED